MPVFRSCSIGIVLTTLCSALNPVLGSPSVDRHSARDDLPTLYYGTSEANSEVRAWWVWLDVQKRAGGIYLPLISPLRDVTLNASGAFSFWAESLGAKYGLTGRLADEQIIGGMTVTPARRGAPPEPSVSLRLIRQSLPAPDSIDWHRSGVFSNAVMNEYSGDLNGIELVIVSTVPLVGSYTDFQREFTPYALLNTVRRRDGFTFSIKGGGAEEMYSATYRGRNLLLRRLSPVKANAVVLQRDGSIRELLKFEERGTRDHEILEQDKEIKRSFVKPILDARSETRSTRL